MVLNVGPQHPSTHGVLHVWLATEGEQILAAEPTHGYLHRCIEKLAESRTYRACTALVDRSDYVSGFFTELALMEGLEELAQIEVPPKALYLRVLLSELCRITSHHTWFGACGLDLGAYTPFLFCFRDREAILDFFEEMTGGRMMFNFFRPGGVKADMPAGWADRLRAYLLTVDASIDGYEALLTDNEIFRNRTCGIGVITPEQVLDFGLTGAMARASGVDVDLRRDEPYAAYGDFDVRVALGTTGDTYDRYLVRVAEMRESVRLALLALDGMPEGDFITPGVSRMLRPPAGAAYRRVESPRGELGVYVEANGSTQPWRLKIRPPAFSNLHVAPAVLPGCMIGDVMAILGSIDVVLGEIDR
jgi:NADH-quinone oxidoreductase subunit D